MSFVEVVELFWKLRYKVISIKPEFYDLLKAEAIKNRYNKKKNYITYTSTKNCC